MLPLCDKEVKAGNSKKSIFELFTRGVTTSRDEWVYDFALDSLLAKTEYFCDCYNKEIVRWNHSKKNIPIADFVDRKIKWTDELELYLKKGQNLNFDKDRIIVSQYRPFVKMYTYFDRIITHRTYLNEQVFGIEKKYSNRALAFSGLSSSKTFQCIAINQLGGLDLLEKTQCLPIYRYDSNGNQIENITDWGLNQFGKRYGKKGLNKEAIFYYVYAVLHNPAYLEKYEQNLKREFPRVPFYEDFKQWSNWGKALMDLHINYETVKPFKLEREEIIYELQDAHAYSLVAKAKLKADKTAGRIVLDGFTTLTGIPPAAWAYKLGNRSALEWILDQYKESKPKDPTIAEKFNTYSFSDYKEQVIDLLKRVTTVSVETMKIIEEMKAVQTEK